MTEVAQRLLHHRNGAPDGTRISPVPRHPLRPSASLARVSAAPSRGGLRSWRLSSSVTIRVTKA
jgi:hypothetical protein